MLELPLIFVSGVLGSSHCIGMCGGFALSIGARTNRLRSNLARQIVWSGGRVFTYAFAGAAAGHLGGRASGLAWPIAPVQSGLAIAAGVLLLIQGLLATGLVPRRPRTASKGPCLTGSLLSSFLTAPGLLNVFLAGILTGFMPCGLVYAFVALAASTGGLLHGALVMTAFGLGTMPVMIAACAGASLMTLATRTRLVRAAAWCVVLTGAVTVGRGIAFAGTGSPEQPHCPFCRPEHEPRARENENVGRASRPAHTDAVRRRPYTQPHVPRGIGCANGPPLTLPS